MNYGIQKAYGRRGFIIIWPFPPVFSFLTHSSLLWDPPAHFDLSVVVSNVLSILRSSIRQIYRSSSQRSLCSVFKVCTFSLRPRVQFSTRNVRINGLRWGSNVSHTIHLLTLLQHYMQSRLFIMPTPRCSSSILLGPSVRLSGFSRRTPMLYNMLGGVQFWGQLWQSSSPMYVSKDPNLGVKF